MARQTKAVTNLQIFRGSLPKQDIFAQHADIGCCVGNVPNNYDKLGPRVHFDNALAHSNPTGANDKINLPDTGYTEDRMDLVSFINDHGVGATISALVVPTYAFVTGLAVTVSAMEAGLTFDIVTRNGLQLPTSAVHVVDVSGSACSPERALVAGDEDSFAGFGQLEDDVLYQTIIGRDGDGEFSLEADEIMLRVASMPASGKISGDFRLQLAISYDIVARAEF